MSEKRRYWFEDVPEDQRFYFLVQYPEGEPEAEEKETEIMQRASVFGVDPEKIEELDHMAKVMAEIGFAPNALSPTHWSDVEDRPDPQTPRIFTTRERAEERLRYHSDLDVELQTYGDLVEIHGEEVVNRALDNSSPLRVVWTTREALLDALAFAEFSHLMVDDQVVSSHTFTLELMRKLEEG
jgi:hypothetical protein